MTLKEDKQRIIDETGIEEEALDNLIKEKQKELKGLVSEEGALFIIAKELGVDLKQSKKPAPKPPTEGANKDGVSWMEKARQDPPLAIGGFLPIIEGLTYQLEFEDIDAPNQGKPVQKKSQFKDKDGNDQYQTKWRFNVTLKAVEVQDEYSSIIDSLKVKDKKKWDKKTQQIAELEKDESIDKEYVLELPKTGRYELGNFAHDSALKSCEPFEMTRLSNTNWVFKKL